MALTTSKTIYLNGNSKDGDTILANFNATFDGNSIVNINESRIVEGSSDIEEADFAEFRDLAKKLSSKEVTESD
ncbi:hypothetical protein M5C72_08430 [Companilactobacillus allii]|uniref:Uncharacterized protein n=1 Tax=Companilactobacillus allii TaxID=1847728 RepID=A0A1P8Q5H5_9LACO|nr:hypothetical protein [Companilactobacillus allii]APX73107.1 hypothetical protein BTM29_11335 [Companilactobacillus allii]USQ67908.1 hypothetical protein M5C72_08430 [Companilactobacillus allii]